jgi:dipeptidase
MRTLLDIEWHRPAAMYDCSYGMVSQSRGWLPDPIGGVLWFYLDNPHMSVHVPIYAGVTEILPSWQNFDRNVFSLDSARWAFALADDLVNRRYQSAIQDLKLVRDPLQQEFLDHQAEIELEALNLYNTSGGGGEDAAKQVLTNFTKNCMDEAEQAYWNLNWDLIQKYNNNKF